MRFNASILQKSALVFSGILLSLVLLETGLRLGGFLLISLQECRNMTALKHKDSYVILCLGESTTANGGNNSYPSQLGMILEQKNTSRKFSVVNKGIWGTNTDVIAFMLDKNLNRYSPDMVIAMIGINDGRLGMPQCGNKAVGLTESVIGPLKILNLARYLTANICVLAMKLNIEAPFDWYYNAMGNLYRRDGRFEEAVASFKKALRINPANKSASYSLTFLSWNLGKYGEAETMYKRCIKLNYLRRRCYNELGYMYYMQGRFKLAEKMLTKTVEIYPDERNYLDLSLFYDRTGQLDKAIRTLELFREEDKSDIFYGFMGQLYRKQGKLRLGEEYLKKADEMRKNGYPMTTYYNYRRIADEILGRKIKLVCVQYPVRNINPLKKMMEGYKGIIFVDNEKVFKDAILRNGYDYYFYDGYGGDFGHATPEGNRLLAENIAEAIIKEISR